MEELKELVSSLKVEYVKELDGFTKMMDERKVQSEAHAAELHKIIVTVSKIEHDLSDKISNLSVQHTDLTGKNAELRKGIEEVGNAAKAALAKIEKDISDKEQTSKELDIQVGRIQTVLESVKNERNVAVKEMMDRQADLIKANLQLSTINTEIKTLEGKISKQKETVGELSNQEFEITKRIRTKNEDISVLEDRISKLKN